MERQFTRERVVDRPGGHGGGLTSHRIRHRLDFLYLGMAEEEGEKQ